MTSTLSPTEAKNNQEHAKLCTAVGIIMALLDEDDQDVRDMASAFVGRYRANHCRSEIMGGVVS